MNYHDLRQRVKDEAKEFRVFHREIAEASGYTREYVNTVLNGKADAENWKILLAAQQLVKERKEQLSAAFAA